MLSLGVASRLEPKIKWNEAWIFVQIYHTFIKGLLVYLQQYLMILTIDLDPIWMLPLRFFIKNKTPRRKVWVL